MTVRLRFVHDFWCQGDIQRLAIAPNLQRKRRTIRAFDGIF